MASPDDGGSPMMPPFDEISENPIANGTVPGIAGQLPLLARILPLELRIISSALFIIYVGAHASLKRPPSAAPSVVTRTGKPMKSKKKKDEEDFTQGLLPSDAILFPIMAGTILIGLYYLIQWLQDPSILNKILNVYMTLGGLMSLSGFFGYFIQRAANLVFPNYVRRNGAIYEFDTIREELRPIQSSLPDGRPHEQTNSAVSADRVVSPLPFSLLRTSSRRVNTFLWELRHLLTEDWTVRFDVYGLFAEKFHVQFSQLLGTAGALVIVTMYLMTGSSMLSNLMGLGFCFGSSKLLSPTTFTTGSLVLSGLFFYDIIMVFYTPYMITVATKLDAPIKLTFEGGGKASMLGLGDIVIPGMVMGLALRFDLWRFYQKKTKYVATELRTDMETTSDGDAGRHVVTTTETRHVAKKMPYVDATGRWGDRFWISSWLGLFCKPSDDSPDGVRASFFPKTYFYASMVGYTVGMIVTLCMLIIFKHGQPALLYLVPGVLGSLWLTGLVRGELNDMWIYTEDGSLDTEDVVVELDGAGKVIRHIDDKDKKAGAEADEPKKNPEQEKADRLKRTAEMRAKGYDLYHFSVRAPPRGGEQDAELQDKVKDS